MMSNLSYVVCYDIRYTNGKLRRRYISRVYADRKYTFTTLKSCSSSFSIQDAVELVKILQTVNDAENGSINYYFISSDSIDPI